MSIKIYNTLTRQKEEFIPLEPNKVKMYVCGPTVYNHIHLGNARPALFFDVVRRYLEYRGYEVTYVQNFTDVDDKIIKAAEEMGISAQEVAELFIDSYFNYTDQLGVRRATVHPKVTENMAEIIRFIEQLMAKGFAYEVEGDVYFRTEKFADYGKLSHQRTDELLEGVRIEVNELKESPLDFALWKKAKPGEISWPSPWGEGRPGWHIECSAMIRKYLGETIDIHAGGIDLTFPHHENEIAQTESLTGKPLAKYWMHNAMMLINAQKMSKSEGNIVQINEVLEKYPAEVVRYFMLSAHYRSPLNFSAELLEQAKNGYERLKNALNNLEHRLSTLDERDAALTETEEVHKWRDKFIEAMDDDFNTANAISVLFELAREINTYLQSDQVTKPGLEAYKGLILELTGVLGLVLQDEEALLDEEIEALIAERTKARKERNFARADEIRDLLKAKGIILEDTPQGVRWRRK